MFETFWVSFAPWKYPSKSKLCSASRAKGSRRMSLLTIVHVALSLIGIAAGFLVIFQMMGGKTLGGWNAVFLVTTILTSVTGFFFPITKVTPGLVIGGISILILAISVFALYSKKLAGG